MTTPPPETTIPVVAPTLEETRAINNSLTDDEIRRLAQQITQAASLGFDPTTILKGEITAIDQNTIPPTLTLAISGETTTTVSEVRLLNSYSPQVGHTVLIAKQGPDIVVLGNVMAVGAMGTESGAGDWTVPTLSAGSHNGNSNGDVAYRRVLDHGAWKMQWRGGWNVSGTFMLNTNRALTSEYRPESKRSVLVARQIQGGSTVAQLDFHTDGRVELVGGTTTANSANTTGDVGAAGGFSVSNHSHGMPFDGEGGAPTHNHLGGTFDGGGFSVSNHDHGFAGGSHTHSVTAPTWISLNGVEYFL
jgi:hypothetical protein